MLEGIIKDTQSRVCRSTPDKYNRRIREQLVKNVEYFADHPEEIGGRLQELDREWDIERILETNASSFVLLFLVLGWLVHPYILILAGAVGFFLLLHAVQGWCPPVPIFRARGVRTTQEIDRERNALKALRGDYSALPGNRQEEVAQRARRAIEAAR